MVTKSASGTTLLPLVLLLLVGMVPLSSHAQSLSSQVIVGAANPENSNLYESYGGGFSNTGELVTGEGSTSFFGLDSLGNSQEMHYSGQGMAHAEYLRLRTQASGSVSNVYYSPENPPLVLPDDSTDPDGSPSALQVSAQAVFTDTLQFGGELAPGYRARYQFHITGYLSDPSAFYTMGVTIAGNSERYFSPDNYVGVLGDFYNTQTYPVDGVNPQTVEIQTLSSFAPGIDFLPEGVSVSGEADFFHTAELIGVELLDDNGVVVPTSQWSVTSASGVEYPVGFPVPEPAGLLVSMLATLACVRRRTR